MPTPYGHILRRIEVDSPLIAPDLALDRLHLIVPDESDAMVVLTTLAQRRCQPAPILGLSSPNASSKLGHLTVSFSDEDPSQVRLAISPTWPFSASPSPTRAATRPTSACGSSHSSR